MSPGGLNSDHLNYLVWRYLQESGFGHAAVKLQQFWLRDPQSLPFAHRVEAKALVSLVQKGLKWNQLEQGARSKASDGEAASASALYFGNETGRGNASRSSEDLPGRNGSMNQPLDGTRKHQRESTHAPTKTDATCPSNGLGLHDATDEQRSAVYAPRQSQVSGSPVDSEDHAMDGMDVDEGAEPTVTGGPSIAVQSEKIEDLSRRTSILTVAEKDCIMHGQWNRRLPILASAGMSLCCLMHVPITGATVEPSEVLSQDLLQPSDGSLVTSIAWNPEGNILAIATRLDLSGMIGTVSTWSDTGKALEDLTAGQEMVIKLRWNPSGSYLLGITSSGDGTSSLIAWDMSTSQPFQPVQCDITVMDAVWSSETSIVLCGHGSIGHWDIFTEQDITWAQKMDPQIRERDWTHIFYNPSDHSIQSFAEDTAHAVTFDTHGSIEAVTQIHDDCITAICSGVALNTPAKAVILATASLDTKIKAWYLGAELPFSTFTFGQDAPPLAVAFSPDGSLLAAASHNKVLVWNAMGSHIPVAMWQGYLGKNLKGSLTNGHAADKDSGIGDDATEDGMNDLGVFLGWDADGKRLALGVGNQIALINVRP